MESDDVRIVAVWGMGGIGKTTLVKKLYNLIHRKFEGSCFLAKIRETSKRHGLVVLQEQLLSGILVPGTHNIRNLDQGIEVIKRRAFRRKVLLILDDVDDVKQLKALAIDEDSFGFGSTIIITTRDKSSLNFPKLDGTYAAEELNDDESLELFSWNCFKKDHPPEDHLDLSRQVVHYVGGLPLALEILGSFFRGKSILEWKSAIKKLRKIPDDNIQGILKISFDSLSKDVQELFLDVACFFVGTQHDFTVKILDGCNFFAKIGFRVLADRCLIKYDRNTLAMHDMVRDMGREIVRQESGVPGERSRLWYVDDVLDVLRSGKGTESVKGLHLKTRHFQVNAKPFEKMDRLWYHENVLKVRRDDMGTEADEGCLINFTDPEDVQVNAKGLDKMNDLWLLHLDSVHLTADFEHISRSLKWLSWKGFPLECMPWDLSMEKLIALDLRYSSLKKVWNGNKILGKLKFLYLSHCRYLTRTPDFSGLNSLEELFLNDCKSLVEVDESVRCLNKLLVLDMKNCTKLRKLPNFSGLNSLKELLLSGCKSLVEVDESIRCLKKLVVLDMKNCTKLRKLPSGIWMLKSLECLDLSSCCKLGNSAGFKGPLNKLVCLFFSFWKLPPKDVNSIGISLTSIQAFVCLKELKMAWCSLIYLPDEIGNLISLQTLVLCGNNISALPDRICNLTCLKSLELGVNKLSHLPSEIGRLISLETLDVGHNSLSTLPDSIGNLSCLKSLYVASNNVSHLPSEIGDLVSLVQLYLDGNNICTLPDSICSLTRLDDLCLSGCNLSHLPSEIGNLISLCVLSLDGNNICTLPESISNLHCWPCITLDNCAKLQSLPKLPPCDVYARDCASLESIPLELNQLGLKLNCTGINKLAENDFANRLLKQLHRSKGLAELKEVVSILVPTRSDVPMTYQGTGSCISFEVPRLAGQKMLGWVIGLFITIRNDGWHKSVRITKVIRNKIRMKEFYDKDQFAITSGQDQVWLRYTPQGFKGLELKGGDQVEIPIWAMHATVKNWGVDLIYEIDENITKTNANQEALIQYTSTSYQDVSLPEDFSLANT